MAHWITDANGKRIKVAGNYGKKPDDFLSETSENAVQNKVLYKPVTFAESERLKSQNLFNINNSKASNALYSTWGIGMADFLKEEMIGKTICINTNEEAYRIQITNYTYLDTETDTNKVYYVSESLSYLTFEVTQDLYNNRYSRYFHILSPLAGHGQGLYNNLISIYGNKLMVTYGSEPQAYQPYYGDIVHKKEMAGAFAPSDVYEDLGTSTNFEFTAPANGYIAYKGVSGTNLASFAVVSGDTNDGFEYVFGLQGMGQQRYVPVRKGKKYIIGYSNVATSHSWGFYIRFYYAQGEL